MSYLHRTRQLINVIRDAYRRLDKLEQAIGHLQLQLSQQVDTQVLQDYEFQVYSQGGEDGIIQYLVRNVPIENRIFVEFGVERYTEANTRFLLTHDDWAGLVIDGSADNIRYIKNDRIYWLHSLAAIHAFINKDNINELIMSGGVHGSIGLLSVDIDGNDYWVWEAIDCIQPRIVVCEYNSLFGPHHRVTIPYHQSFMRSAAHYSNVYYGASIGALTHLANRKGYILVGSNSRGNNVFFVQETFADKVKSVLPEEAYVKARFRESRNQQGNLSFLNFEQAFEQIQEMPIYDLDKNITVPLKEMHPFARHSFATRPPFTNTPIT